MDFPYTKPEVEKVKPLTVDPDVALALKAIGQEVMRARSKFKAFNSAHEGYSVILEEVDELWEEVKHKSHDRQKMRVEAMQIAAMAIRFMTDVAGRG